MTMSSLFHLVRQRLQKLASHLALQCIRGPFSVASTAGKLWGMKYRPLIGGLRGRQVSLLPSILSIGIGNFLGCGGNQHLLENQVPENVVSSIHQGLGRSLSRQRMFRNLQTILNISVSFLCHILVDFLRTATDLPSLPKDFCCPRFREMSLCPIS